MVEGGVNRSGCQLAIIGNDDADAAGRIRPEPDKPPFRRMDGWTRALLENNHVRREWSQLGRTFKAPTAKTIPGCEPHASDRQAASPCMIHDLASRTLGTMWVEALPAEASMYSVDTSTATPPLRE